jgi:hypothetical protein
VSKHHPKKIAPDMRLLNDAELDAVIGGYVAPGLGGFATLNASSWSAGPLSEPMWALVSAPSCGFR